MDRKLDNRGRWRNKTVAFRVSEEEAKQIDECVRLSGLTKQDYIVRRLMCRDIVVQGNPRVYKALKNQMAELYEELKRIEQFSEENEEQPLVNLKTNQSIADLPGKGNLQATNNTENVAKSANKKNPDELETVSMMELYDTAYPPKLPIVEGLLYNGTYLFVGSPKIGKSFFMAQIGYHISKGLPLWDFPVRQGTVLYLALEMIMQGYRNGYRRCSEWKEVRTSILLQSPNR